jgi:hypothetical protein
VRPDGGNYGTDATKGRKERARPNRYTRPRMADQEFDNLSEVEYFNRTLPARERPFEVFSMLLSAAALTLGLTAMISGLAMKFGPSTLVFAPFRVGFLAIFLGVIGLATAGDRDRFGRIALVIAGLGWLIGGMLAVIQDKPVW